MKIVIAKDYQEMSERAAREIIALIKAKPDCVLGLATGQTPLLLYRLLVAAHLKGEVSFAKVRTFNLDEYIGLPRDSKDSYWSYMHENFFSQVDVRPENINILDGSASNLQDECRNYEREIDEVGGIDLQILGIGMDGHIGFCEPGTSFAARTMTANLTQTTIESNRHGLIEIKDVPKKALTMGIATIMDARKIILLANGRHKQFIIHKALYGSVSEDTPASVLQRHPDCIVFLDAEAAGE